jgi:hypothetical protein
MSHDEPLRYFSDQGLSYPLQSVDSVLIPNCLILGVHLKTLC